MTQHFSNFSMKKIILAAGITAAVPLAVQAHSNEGMADGHCNKGGEMHSDKHGEMGERSIPRNLKELNLSQVQQDQVFKIMHDEVPAMRDQQIARRNTHEELHNLSRADRFDDAKAQQIADQLVKMEKDSILNRARTEAKIFAVLTLEQRQKARTIESERDAKHKNEPRRGDKMGMDEALHHHSQAADLKEDKAHTTNTNDFPAEG